MAPPRWKRPRLLLLSLGLLALHSVLLGLGGGPAAPPPVGMSVAAAVSLVLLACRQVLQGLPPPVETFLLLRSGFKNTPFETPVFRDPEALNIINLCNPNGGVGRWGGGLLGGCRLPGAFR